MIVTLFKLLLTSLVFILHKRADAIQLNNVVNQKGRIRSAPTSYITIFLFNLSAISSCTRFVRFEPLTGRNLLVPAVN